MVAVELKKEMFLRTGNLRLLPVMLALLLPSVSMAQFKPITEEHQNLKEAPGYPGAPAIFLYETAHLTLMDYPRMMESKIEIQVRKKILSQQGLEEHSRVEIQHSNNVRIASIDARTVLPNGKTITVDESSIFEEELSQREGISITRITFPAVEVGAILDYRYALQWGSLHIVYPWYFNNSLPTLISRITYRVPPQFKGKPYGQDSENNPIELDADREAGQLLIEALMKNPAPISEEPWGWPVEDLSSYFVFVPEQIVFDGVEDPILDSWETVYESLEKGSFRKFRKGSKTKSLVKQLTAGMTTQREKATAVYRFVRDEIRWAGRLAIIPEDEKANVAKVLKKSSGNAAEQALLLQEMLADLNVDSNLVWARFRDNGLLEPEVVNIGWFNTTLLEVYLDDSIVFLYPADPRLAFGQLPSYLAATRALANNDTASVVITLPESTASENTRRAALDFTLDDEGRLSGKGHLTLTGYHAHNYLKLHDDEEEASEAWEDWLEENIAGFETSDIEWKEMVADGELRLSFSLTQSEDEVLGDEAELSPSVPLGPLTQEFNLPTEKRKTPVMLAFADHDLTTVNLTWPEDWDVDLIPQDVRFSNAIGTLGVSLELDEEARRLTFERRLEINQRELVGREAYGQIRELYRTTEKSDAQSIVLVRQ